MTLCPCGFIHEEFVMGFTYAEKVDAKCPTVYITSQLETDCRHWYKGLDCNAPAWWADDRQHGVQADENKGTSWLHGRFTCTVRHLIVARSLSTLLTSLLNYSACEYLYLEVVCVHPHWLRLQTQMYPNQKAIELKSLSETRWTTQIAACHAVTTRLDVILASIQIGGNTNIGIEPLKLSRSCIW